MVASRRARAVLIAIGLVLLVPVLGVRLQGTAELEAFQNRVLTPWPEFRSFLSNPPSFFAQINRWLADRAYPIIVATSLKNNLAYFALGASPRVIITVARNGFIFLNGAVEENDLLEGACVKAVSPRNVALVRAALDRLAEFGRSRGVPIDVVLVPTVPVLYGDRLPRAIPSRLREACQAAGPGRSALARVQAPESVHFVYPIAAIGALRDDTATFPLGNFHPDGLSVKVVRDHYLAAIGADSVATETVMRSTGFSELLTDGNIQADFPVYRVSASGATTDEAAAGAIQAATAHLYENPINTYVYRNTKALDPRTVLILSDSYGYAEGISFSAAFRTVVQMPESGHLGLPLLEAIMQVVPFDRLVLLFNDTNSGSIVRAATEFLPTKAVLRGN